MTRVCRPNGTVAIEDLVSSEHPSRAEFQNQIERLRDRSHTRALAPSYLLTLLATAGLEIQRLYSSEVVQNLERWIANSQTPADQAMQVGTLIERDSREDLCGMRPYCQDGEWFFHHPTLTVIARKLGAQR
jgi:hypothetical protein